MKIFGYDFNLPQRSEPVVKQLYKPSGHILPNLHAYHGRDYNTRYNDSVFDGDKFPGGFGPTGIEFVDYYALRTRSSQLFNGNLYARGLIRRFVTNEINTGLTPDLFPDEEVIGVPENSLDDWTDTVENRFGLYSKSPTACDWKRQSTFGALQRMARMEALVEGDILVTLRITPPMRLPKIQFTSGSKIVTPMGASEKATRKGNKIIHGVELDEAGRHVGYWVRQDDASMKRQPARGERSGRLISWLIYGTDKRLDSVRGQPLLSLVLQSLREIDRYRDSTQRKATINSLVAMFIKKTNDKMGTLPMQNGAVRLSTVTPDATDEAARSYNVADYDPGIIMDELQVGEEPVPFSTNGTDQSFGEFEESIIQAVAWANEVPPEILRLSFSNNYSASQAAINEYKMYLNMVWAHWGETFCTPIYVEWFVSEVLLQNITAPGFLEAWRDKSNYAMFGAWTSVDWYGSIKPSTDMLKQVKASRELIEAGLSTRTRESRITTGTNYRKNIKRQKRENEQWVEANTPLAEFKEEFTPDADNQISGPTEELNDNVVGLIELVEETNNGQEINIQPP